MTPLDYIAVNAVPILGSCALIVALALAVYLLSGAAA